MIWQLHHQYRDGRTDMIAQKDFNESNKSEYPIWVREIVDKYPLLENAQWLACNEQSECFVGVEADNGK